MTKKHLFQGLFFLIFLLIIWCLLFGYFPFLLFAMTCMIVMICFVVSFVPMKMTTVEIHCLDRIIERNQPLKICFQRVENGPLSCGSIVVNYEIIDIFEKVVQKGYAVIDGDHVSCQIKMNHCGHDTIRISSIVCYDILQCFHRRHLNEAQIEVDILPHYQKRSIDFHQMENIHQDGNFYSSFQKGDDYSEIYELKSYQQGDTLKHIHWKASLKSQDFLVKVGSQPMNQKIILAMEYQQDQDIYDHQLDYFYSLCLELLKHQITFEIVTVCQKESWETRTIHHTHDLLETLQWLMKNPILQLSHHSNRTFYWIQGETIKECGL